MHEQVPYLTLECFSKKVDRKNEFGASYPGSFFYTKSTINFNIPFNLTNLDC